MPYLIPLYESTFAFTSVLHLLPRSSHFNYLLTACKMTCVLTLLTALLFTATGRSTASHLHLTALITKPNGAAAFECWRVSQPFRDYPTVGSAISGLADVSNVSYVVLPPRSEEGLHKPPHPM